MDVTDILIITLICLVVYVFIIRPSASAILITGVAGGSKKVHSTGESIHKRFPLCKRNTSFG